MLFNRRRRRYSSRYERKSRRFRWLPALLLIIGIPIGVELLARLVVNMAGLTDKLTLDQTAPIMQAYELGFVDPEGDTYERLRSEGELAAARNPLLGYRLLPSQTSDFWTINPQGFRDTDPVTPEKTGDEVRIFVLGGSTAFGQLSTNNAATFAEKLEAQLNNQVAQQAANPGQFQPAVLPYRADQVTEALALPPRIRAGQYRVVNAAIPGYASGNELALLVQHVAAYNPDILVVIDSYPDLLLPSNQPGTDIPGIESALHDEQESLGRRFNRRVSQWFNHLYSVQLVKYYTPQAERPDASSIRPLNLLTGEVDGPLSQQLAADETELNQRVNRYRQHLLQMVHWTSGTRKRLIVGVQPEITGRAAEALTASEAAIVEELGDDYTERVQQGYAKLAEAATQATQASENAKALNLYRLYETFEGQAFHSPTGLTDEANTVLADTLYQAIAADLAISPQPFGSAP
ncbi:SGNH/GDSL hydrolase family protein [Sphaerothrix gracilis]|uniref:SGNH/GDSL hydrolase family protein n=1 Tax=Sphaerothrix gracilis TaxID=3151835 RepID=UPI0031FBEF7F